MFVNSKFLWYSNGIGNSPSLEGKENMKTILTLVYRPCYAPLTDESEWMELEIRESRIQNYRIYRRGQ